MYIFYIFYVLYCLKSSPSVKYDLERIIDDWVLIGFMVGNDFIPHLPNFHIQQDMLVYLWNTYKEVLPCLGGEVAFT